MHGTNVKNRNLFCQCSDSNRDNHSNHLHHSVLMLHNKSNVIEKIRERGGRLQKRDESLFIIHDERETTLIFIHAEVLEKMMKFSIPSHIA